MASGVQDNSSFDESAIFARYERLRWTMVHILNLHKSLQEEYVT